MDGFIPYGRQWLDDADFESVRHVLESDYLTQGPVLGRFEKAIQELTGAKYCVAVSSGTAALHLAVSSLEIEDGLEGITSPITFVASANSMLYSGLVPRFADIDPKTYNISTADIERRLTDKTGLIMPVHFAGQPADMQGIHALAKKKGCLVIEDASHAIGSEYVDGDPIGSCRYSDLTVFSFHPVKTITTGEGGAITTNNPVLYERLKMLRTHGITKDPSLLGHNHGPWYYEMQMLGFNYRLTEMQAALGTSQLAKLGDFRNRRRAIVETYNQSFENHKWLTTPFESPRVKSCFHLYVLLIDFAAAGISRQALMESLREKGVGSQVHYIPVHLQPYYQKVFGFSEGNYPVAESYYEKALSIPLYPAMGDEQVRRVISAVQAVLGEGEEAGRDH